MRAAVWLWRLLEVVRSGMLQIFRKSVSSWVGAIILLIAVGALVVTLFQPGGPANAPGATGPVMATAGSTSLTESEFLTAVDRATRQERERQPTMTQADFINAGGGDMVYDQLVANRAISAFAEKNDMVVSQRVIDGEIASIPAAQVNGKFDDATFRRFLSNQRLTEQELRDEIADTIKRRQLLQPVAAASLVPRGMAEPYAALLLEVRRGSILTVPSAAMPEPKAPTDAELAAFHKENARAYTIPERRAFRFATVTAANIADRARPTEAEIAADYKARAGEYGSLETRGINFVVLPDAAKAKAFVAQVRGGKPFADAAKAAGFSAEDIALGAQSQQSLADEFRPEVAKAAFALAGPGVTDPVATQLGQYVIEVTNIVAPKPIPLSNVRAEIEKRLMDQKLETLLADLVNDAEERLSGGESFAEVARRHGLVIETAPAMTADGRVFDENFAVSRLDIPAVAKVFGADQADGPQVADLGNGQFALFEVSEVISPLLVPVEKIREDVTMAYMVRQRSDAAKAAADRIAAAISKGEAIGPAVGDLRLPAPQPLAVRRLELTQMAQAGRQVPPPVTMLLSTPRGKARVVPAPGGQGWFVVAVQDVQPGNLAEAPQLVDMVRQGFGQQASEEMVVSLVRAIERDVSVVRKPEALTAAKKRITGATAG